MKHYFFLLIGFYTIGAMDNDKVLIASGKLVNRRWTAYTFGNLKKSKNKHLKKFCNRFRVLPSKTKSMAKIAPESYVASDIVNDEPWHQQMVQENSCFNNSVVLPSFKQEAQMSYPHISSGILSATALNYKHEEIPLLPTPQENNLLSNPKFLGLMDSLNFSSWHNNTLRNFSLEAEVSIEPAKVAYHYLCVICPHCKNKILVDEQHKNR